MGGRCFGAGNPIPHRFLKAGRQLGFRLPSVKQVAQGFIFLFLVLHIRTRLRSRPGGEAPGYSWFSLRDTYGSARVTSKEQFPPFAGVRRAWREFGGRP